MYDAAVIVTRSQRTNHKLVRAADQPHARSIKKTRVSFWSGGWAASERRANLYISFAGPFCSRLGDARPHRRGRLQAQRGKLARR